MDTTMFLSEYKDMYQSEDRLWWYLGTRGILKNYLKRLINPTSKILDAGCGTGKTMTMLMSEKYNIQGIDLSKNAIAYCKKRGLTNVRQASITKIPSKANCFDAVLNIDVLGVLPKDLTKKAISEFYRVLKPGGYVIIQCAALEWLRSQHDTVTNIKIRYQKNQLEQLFAQSKWYIVKSSYRIFFLFFPIMLIKLTKKIFGGKVSKTDQYIPPTPINKILTGIQLLENTLFSSVDFPVGSSIFLIAKKLK